MSGIKKFGDHMVIAHQVRKQRTYKSSEGWTHLLPSKFLAQTNRHILQDRPPMFGQIDFGEFLLRDALAIATGWTIVAKHQPTGVKLKHIPVFYRTCVSESHSGHCKKTYRGTARQFLQRYKQSEMLHKLCENHHPDSPSFRRDHFTSFEVVMDVYSSLLRESSVQTSYDKLLNILATEKFKILNPLGVICALLHLKIRGVASGELFRISANWRRTKSPELLEKYNQDYLNGIPPPSEISSYRYETSLHAESVRIEMKRIRSPNKNHDYTKFHSDILYYYSWYWGVFKQMTEVQQTRVLAGCVGWQTFAGKHTMHSVRGTLAAGVSEGLRTASPEIQGHIDYGVNRLSETMNKVFKENTETFQNSMKGVFDGCVKEATGQVKQLMGDFFSGTREMSQEFVDHFASKASEVLATVTGVGTEFNQILNSFKGIIQGVVDGFQEQFLGPVGLGGINLNPLHVFLGLQYLVMLLNVDSYALKAFFLFMFLHNFGILRLAWKAIQAIYSFVLPQVTVDDQEEMRGEHTDTEGGVFNFIFSNAKNLLSVIVVVFMTVLKGVSCLPEEIGAILKIVAGNMRNFHFIGGGLLGIQRIIETARTIWTKVSEWFMIKVLKRTPERKAVAQKVLQWALLVRFFSTEAGMNAIRFNKKMFERADRLFSEGQALLAETSSVGNCPDRDMQLQLQRYWRNVQTIASFIARIKSTSSFQPTMFHIQLVGAPGIGKSTLVKRLVAGLLDKIWDGDHTNGYWSYNPSLEYFDGYSGQKIMLVDDLFRYNEPKHLTTLLTLITNVPVILPMANLEDKGIQLTSQIMVSTTNTAYPTGKDVFCMDAVHRRRHLLVEVNMDKNVEDPSTKAFSQARFDEFYKGQKAEDFPHLSFNLLKPVPSDMVIEQYLSENADDHKALAAYAAELENANLCVVKRGGFKETKLDPTFYYNSENIPPEPLRVPCKNWDFPQLLTNTVLRYHAFRGMELSYNPERKYAHTLASLNDIDSVIMGLDKIDSPLLEQYYYKLEQPYPIPMPNGEKYVAPAFESKSPTDSESSSIDIDELSFDIVNPEPSTSSGKHTMDGPTDEKILSRKASPHMPPVGLSLAEEMARRKKIMEKSKKVVRDVVEDSILIQYDAVHMGLADKPDKRTFIPVRHDFSVWSGTIKIPSHGIGRFARLRSIGELNKLFLEGDLIANFKPDHFDLTHPDGPEGAAWDYYNRELQPVAKFGKQFALSALASYPSSFPPELAGKTSSIPWFFLKNLREKDNGWYFEMPEPLLAHPKLKIVTVYNETSKKNYDIPFDNAFLLSAFDPYRVCCIEFCSLSPAQQREMVELAAWREQYTGLYNFKDLRETLSTHWNEMRESSLPVRSVASFVDWICCHKMDLVRGVLLASTAIASLLVIREMCKVFTRPLDGEPTSRVLHRAPQSNVTYKGRFTALNESTTYTNFLDSFSRRNLRYIQFVVDDQTYGVQALTTKNFILMPAHVMRKFSHLDEVLMLYHHPKGGEPIEIMVPTNQIEKYAKGDLALLYSNNLPISRDISSYLYTEEQMNNVELIEDVTFMSRYEGELSVERYHNSRRARKIRMRSEDGTTDEMLDSIIVDGSTMVGKSGSPVMSPIKALSGQYLLGIQAWQLYPSCGNNQIAVQVLTREILDDLSLRLCSRLKVVPICRESEYEFSDISSEMKGLFTMDVLVQEVSRNEAVGEIGKTQFGKTPIAKLMERDGIKSERVPAASSRFDRRLRTGTKFHPLEHSLNKYERGNLKAFSPKILNRIENDLCLYFRNTLDKRSFRELEFDEAITGTREDGSNPMDLSTSPGIPFIYDKHEMKGKKDYIRIGEDGEIEHVSPEFKTQFESFERKMKMGLIPLGRSYDFPKDELRPIDKALGTSSSPPKTRSVTCMNMNYIILWRKLTLDFWASQHRAAGSSFPLCPGMNPEGPDWTEMHRCLRRFAKFVDFDVSNWDGFMPPPLLMTAGRIVARLCGYKPGSPEETALLAILCDVLFGYVQFSTVIYEKTRGMISGFPGTAEMNSLVHLILIYYIYLTLVGNRFKSFSAFLHYVQTYVYGDDILIGISDEIIEFFNGETIASEYQRIGYPVTSADKTGKILKYKSLDRCQFLKSNWRHLEGGIYLRVLDLTVAIDLLYWVRSKQHLMTQFYSNISDAMFIVFAHGREKYDEWLDRLNTWLVKLNYPPFLVTYDDQLEDYLNRYYLVD